MNDGEPPQKFLLKDHLFNPQKVAQIAQEIERVHPAFQQKKFAHTVVSKFPELELKARISWIAQCLKQYLPDDYRQAVGVLVKALPAPNNPNLSDDDFGDFIYAPYSEYVVQNGCTREHLEFSLAALREITMRFSAEDAIRHFINGFPEETLKELLSWAKDPHYHVRRLCSEGSRPKLPWSQKINIPVTAPLPILEQLFSDPTRFVTRSVANHLNDISKIDAGLALDTLERWRKTGKQKPKEMDFMVRHALRTLVKQGDPRAMRMLGFSDAPKVNVTNFIVPEQVEMNTVLEFSFSIQSKEDTDVVVDYILHFQNKLGKLSGKKVFKLTQLVLAKNKPVVVSKRHKLREHMTTRRLYPGQHEIEIQVNGKVYAKASFLLG